MPSPARASVLEAAAVATDHADRLVLGAVRDVHGAVARRVHTVVDGVAGRTTMSHRLHDGVAGVVYGSISTGLRAGSAGLRLADRRGVGGDVEATGTGRFLRAAVNGLIGDRLADDGSGLAIEMGIRAGGRDVPMSPEAIADAHPQATDAVLVFVHGLCESEASWDRTSRPCRADGSTAASYGVRLAAEEGWSPVFVRANTGLPIAESGVALSALMDRLVSSWPTDVRRIALVGHSMGGLIIRAACGVRIQPGEDDWKPLVTDIVTLGTPHLGSSVERTIARGVRAADHLPELRPFARILEQRSRGVLDLHDGLPDDAGLLPRARYHLVAGTLSPSSRHPEDGIVGDLLVSYRSAVAEPRRGPALFPSADVLHVPGAHHFDLLNHDDVYAALCRWLRDRTADVRCQ